MNDFVLLTEDEVKASDRDALVAYAASIRAAGKDALAAADKARALELSTALDAVNDRIAALDEEAALAAASDKFAAETPAPVAETVVVDLSVPTPQADAVETAVENFRMAVVAPAIAGQTGGMIRSAAEFGKALTVAHKLAAGPVQGRDEKTYKSLFSVNTNFGLGVTFGQDETVNADLFKSVVAPSAVAFADPDSEDSLVASGGYCKPLNTTYDIPFYAEVCPTFDEFLPSVQTNDGGIKFMRPPTTALTEAAAGIAVITAAQDAAGYDCETPAGPTPCKPCTKISCPTTAECTIDMITQCIQFGNLNWRTFPQYVDYAMKAMAVAWNRRKNQYFLDKIDDPANTIPVAGPAQDKNTPEADIVRDLLTVAARYRAEYGKCYGSSVLKLALPGWLRYQLIINATKRGLAVGASEADFRSFMRGLGFDVFFYEGSAAGASQGLAAQATGNIVPLPTAAVAYLFSPDSFTVLRGGTLDFGLVRDSSLNHANNLEIMMEEFLGFCRTGIQGYRVTLNINPAGAPIEGQEYQLS